VIELGIRAHDLGRMSAIDLRKEALQYGFSGIQLVIPKALSDPFDYQSPEKYRHIFSPLKIMMLGAYFNPVDPDFDKVTLGIHNFKKHLQIAKGLGALCVGSETGSLMGTPWGYVPENHRPETLARVIDIFHELVLFAEKHDTYVAVEGAYNHVAYDPQQIKIMLDAIQHPRLRVVVDLFNFLHPGNHQEHLALLDRSLSLFQEKIIILHLKDYQIENGVITQVGLGKGLMDYPSIISRIKRKLPHVHLIFEGVKGDDIASSFQYISQLINKE